MMRNPLFIVLPLCSLFLFACSGKTSENPENEPKKETPAADTPKETKPLPKDPDPVAAPEGFDKIGEAEGDLDKDGIPEKVIVFNTPEKTDFGTARKLMVFKIKDNQWEEWFVSDGGVLPSEHGGMMGDPFEGVNIERGAIVIDHFGGSRWKWTYKHRYRYQNEAWELIGATVTNGAPCEYFEEYDYNLSTGKIIYRKQTEKCDDSGNLKDSVTEEKEFAEKPGSLPQMTSFQPGETELAINGSDKIFYF